MKIGKNLILLMFFCLIKFIQASEIDDLENIKITLESLKTAIVIFNIDALYELLKKFNFQPETNLHKLKIKIEKNASLDLSIIQKAIEELEEFIANPGLIDKLKDKQPDNVQLIEYENKSQPGLLLIEYEANLTSQLQNEFQEKPLKLDNLSKKLENTAYSAESEMQIRREIYQVCYNAFFENPKFSKYLLKDIVIDEDLKKECKKFFDELMEEKDLIKGLENALKNNKSQKIFIYCYLPLLMHNVEKRGLDEIINYSKKIKSSSFIEPELFNKQSEITRKFMELKDDFPNKNIENFEEFFQGFLNKIIIFDFLFDDLVKFDKNISLLKKWKKDSVELTSDLASFNNVEPSSGATPDNNQNNNLNQEGVINNDFDKPNIIQFALLGRYNIYDKFFINCALLFDNDKIDKAFSLGYFYKKSGLGGGFEFDFEVQKVKIFVIFQNNFGQISFSVGENSFSIRIIFLLKNFKDVSLGAGVNILL